MGQQGTRRAVTNEALAEKLRKSQWAQLGLCESTYIIQIVVLSDMYPNHSFKTAIHVDYVSITIRSKVQTMNVRTVYLYKDGVVFSIGFTDNAKMIIRQLFEQCYLDGKE